MKPKSSAAMVGTAIGCHPPSPTKPFAASSTNPTISKLLIVGGYGGSRHETSTVHPCMSAALLITYSKHTLACTCMSCLCMQHAVLVPCATSNMPQTALTSTPSYSDKQETHKFPFKPNVPCLMIMQVEVTSPKVAFTMTCLCMQCLSRQARCL